MHVARCVEVSRFAKLRSIARVVAKLRIIETQLHVAREGNRSVLANLPFDFFAERAHSPFGCGRRDLAECV